MPVPKRKRSRARRDKRFANKGISVKAFAMCKTCKDPVPVMPHSACKACGHYKGVKVMTTKKDRAEKRGSNKKRMAQKAKAQQAAAAAVSEPKESQE